MQSNSRLCSFLLHLLLYGCTFCPGRCFAGAAELTIRRGWPAFGDRAFVHTVQLASRNVPMVSSPSVDDVQRFCKGQVWRLCSTTTIMPVISTQCVYCRRQLQVKRLADVADIVFCSYIVFERDACTEDRAFLCAQKWQYLVRPRALTFVCA